MDMLFEAALLMPFAPLLRRETPAAPGYSKKNLNGSFRSTLPSANQVDAELFKAGG